MNYIIQSNKITLSNCYDLEFEFPIKTVLVVDEVIIILVGPPSDVIYNHNVFAISLTGDFLWKIGPVKLNYWGSDDCLYIQAIINDENELVFSTGVIQQLS